MSEYVGRAREGVAATLGFLAGFDYYWRKIGHAFVTLISVTTITFALFRLMPGNPAQAMRAQFESQLEGSGQAADPEVLDQMVQVHTGFDPSQPIYMQYFEYVRDIVLYQDFGQSIQYGDPVFDILFRAMPWSVFISVYGLALGYSTNILLGAAMAYKEGSRFDGTMTVVATFLNSIPYYVGALLFLAFFAHDLGWFPSGGRYDTSIEAGLNPAFMASIVHHGALPIMSSFIVGFGGGALAMRGNSVRILGADYLRVARLRGIGSVRIATRYVARNAILPLYTQMMIGIAAVFSSSVVLEYIFTYPGVGWYTFDAINMRDYPLLMGSFLFFTIVTLIGILLAEFTYGIVDPRAGSGGENESY
ncbi:ABC transporter permease [Saliphagus infecundisoli]|uniref:ABC transporter permease n=1 Tax=Saliphagus infecundisoli TaxID=1849069 RepID=A0ABD5Q9N1_9EURY|nr:ABC transporter permease [Saliphagus infecundisoli]